ncbi:hypothetical protein ACIQTZ_16995 [Paenarthrobacter sp. NPDC090520]|uniref:hypothetical protein n=1 Tax=Paenarthrobacter sp. NPDC090520 TaxID=3364382 RepID=UPI003807780C
MTDLRTPGAAKQPPHRYRLTVPHADEAVIAWLELQDNQSLSIRMLIREGIARQGYVDIVNRPVVQLPAGRDRPVDSISSEASDAAPGEPTPTPADPGAAPDNPPAAAPVDVNHLFAQLRR